ncbi:MAG: zinc metalloprotease, partial [Verrucomicrobiota bacterium]|nr:zinc metalloprotease [Verrucomicrobiota bacterium]
MAAHMMLLEKYPSFRLAQMRLEGATERRRDLGHDQTKSKLVTIKTVVNVVYKTPEQNISDAQIASQIAILNKDFRATNPDKSKAPAVWKGLVSDALLQFKLVKTTRTKTTKDGFGADDAVKKTST